MAVLAISALAVCAIPASASAPASNNAKFCNAADKIGSNSSSSQPTKKQAEDAVKDFKRAAKYSSGKVKSAMNNIVDYLEKIADADGPTDLAKIYSGANFKDYAKSIRTYVGALTKCAASTATT
jgi:hypothetical protein